MYFGTTDGKEISSPDMCVYCNMTTSGEHQGDCPQAQGRYAIDFEVINMRSAEEMYGKRCNRPSLQR
jgi:hypothetical protein